jgi:PncC family amidohydrolase
LGGFVAYAYEAKVAMLGVSWDTLRAYGAVSRETVLEMARGTRLGLSASIGLSVTGIAGPGGGLPHKPVGTTWIGLSTAERDVARQYAFSGDRFQNKLSASDEALRLLIEYLEGRLS